MTDTLDDGAAPITRETTVCGRGTDTVGWL